MAGIQTYFHSPAFISTSVRPIGDETGPGLERKVPLTMVTEYREPFECRWIDMSKRWKERKKGGEKKRGRVKARAKGPINYCKAARCRSSFSLQWLGAALLPPAVSTGLISRPLGTWQKLLAGCDGRLRQHQTSPSPRPSSGQERGFPQPAKKGPNKAACTTPVIKPLKKAPREIGRVGVWLEGRAAES